jgi:quinol monooxygenase YgiN
MVAMQAFGFLVTLEAIPGRQGDVVEFLEKAGHLVETERGTRTWYAFRSGSTTFGIFDTFDTADDRDVHLHGEVRLALQEAGDDLFRSPPVITPVDVLASKRPA